MVLLERLIMNRLLRHTVALLATAAAGIALAQAPSTDGEITKLDRAAARVSIKHNGIKSLDMPPMTMAFRTRDPKVLDGMAVGDKVRFAAEKIDGTYTVTALVKAP